MRALVFPALLLLLAPFLAPGTAAAQPEGAQPLDRLLPQIRRDHPGQFLDAEGAETGGNPHYHLKWLTPDGRVMWLDTDARTGRVLRQSPGRDNFDAPRYGGKLEWRAAPGVVGRISQCARGWCYFDVRGRGGFVQADRLWGVDPGETLN